MASPIQLFQEARTILCLCPCCREIVRLSDLKLRYKGVTPTTWLDTYHRRTQRLTRKEERFLEEEEGIREAARERGRKKALRAVRGVVQAALPGCRYDPKDIKAILHPVDYVVFCGLAKEQSSLNKIVLLSKETDSPALRQLRNSIQDAVEREAYEWHVARVTDTGAILLE